MSDNALGGDDVRVLQRLELLVNSETPSGDAHRLRAAHRLLAEWGREALGRSPVEQVVAGVPHLLWPAESAEPAVLVLGHLDTVFPAGTTRTRPFWTDGERATGPGIFDMKAGIVVALEALGLVADTSRVAMLLTGDEETGSITSRAMIEEQARAARAVLVLEPSLHGALKTGRKGGSFYDVVFTGRAAHAGLEPEKGRSALLELARWALDIGDLGRPGEGTTVTPTRAQAGTATNVVPDRAVLTLDVRAASLGELERVHDELRRRAPVGDDVTVEVRGGINRPPLEPTASTRLVELCREVALELGQVEPETASVGGGSDGNFTAALGVPTLDGLGPHGDGAHAESEWIDVAGLGDRVRLVAGLVTALLEEAVTVPVTVVD